MIEKYHSFLLRSHGALRPEAGGAWPSLASYADDILLPADGSTAACGLDLARLDIERVVHDVTDLVSGLIRDASSAVAVIDGNELIFPFSRHPELKRARLLLDSSLAGRCCRTGEPLVSDDVQMDARVDRGLASSLGAQSLVVVPIRHAEKPVGALTVASPRLQAFSSHDIQTLELVAGLVGAAMWNASQFAANQQLLEQMTSTVAALQESEARYRDLFDNANDIVYTHDLDGNFTSINRAAEQLSGYSREEVLHLNIAQIVAPESLPVARRMIADKLAGRSSTTYELDILTKDGRRVRLEVSTRLLFRGGGPEGVQGIGRDITERKRVEEALREQLDFTNALTASLQHQAQHDALTGLPNRHLLQERLTAAIAAGGSAHIALLLLDLNRFKEVNDTFGHHFGDLLLKEAGARLRDGLRELDLVTRLGGDEFAILLPGTGRQGAIRAAEKIGVALEAPFWIEGLRFSVGASIGIALYPEHGSDTRALLQHADVAMYVAKRGHAGFAFYEKEHDQHHPARLNLVTELRSAIDAGQLVLHYQPKVNLRTGCDHHVEALVRWQRPTHGLVAPDQFIAVAEENGLVEPLTVWVLEEALGQCREWRRHGYDMSVAVNLSARVLRAPWLIETIERVLTYLRIEGGALELEITESGVMADPERASVTLSRLREMGIRISVDDFGTGYSSLAYLKRLPVDELKIDRSFVRDMLRDESDAVIVRSVVELGHNLRLQVTAEGVEDEETLVELGRIGCDMAQGYHLCHPLDGEALAGWLAARPNHVHG